MKKKKKKKFRKSNSRFIKRKTLAKNSAWYPAIWDKNNQKKTRAPPVIPTRNSYSMTDVPIAGPVNAAEEQSSTCSPTDNSHTPSSKVVSSQSEIPHTLTTTYRITAGEHETCCYSNQTQNPFDPLLNTEQEKAATAEMNQTEGTDSHTPVGTTQRRHRQNAEKSKDNTPKMSPKEILGNISIPPKSFTTSDRRLCDQTY